MNTTKLQQLFEHINALYGTQYYRLGDYCAKVRALHALLARAGIVPMRYPCA